jgi:CDP-diacylglycerol--glycerol-3-phosphate 3-phosphatidyltransferase
MNRLTINTLSFSRIIFGILFLYVALFDFNTINLVLIFALAILSDILDGHFTRKYDLSSAKGSEIDVICDFIFILSTTLALVFRDIIPFWFLFIIILKLIEFFMTSGSDGLKYDRFGTFVAYMFYAFPIIAIFIDSKNIIFTLTVFITACAIASSILRIRDMKRTDD